MMFASVASALGLAASLGVQSSQASPVPLNKYSDLERRFPHFNYTVNDDDYDVFTYNGDNWYHQHNQSFSNDLDANYQFNTGSGTVEYQIWGGKKNDRGHFVVLFDGDQVGKGDAYSDSESGTESEMLFSQKGLDTANHQITVKNQEDERVKDDKPYLDVDYIVIRS